MTLQPIIQLTDLHYTYEGESEAALSNINLTLSQGDWLTIVGSGGSGKTTLCRLLCGILHQYPGGLMQGSYYFDGFSIDEDSANRLVGLVGAVYRDPESALIHDIVEDELAFGPENLRITQEEIERRILNTLMNIGMSEALGWRTAELSGGQQQRIAIASVLTMEPKLIILDDAVSYLDAPARRKLEAILLKLHQHGHTIITTTSRLEDHTMPAQRILALNKGRIVMDQTVSENQDRLHHELTRAGCWEEKYIKKTKPPKLNETTNPLLKVSGLHFAYASSSTKPGHSVLDNFHMELESGEFLAILGPNGSGKTTFGKLLTGLLPAPRGVISILGRDITDHSLQQLALSIGYVFQHPDHQFVADTVFEECAFGLYTSTGQSFFRNKKRSLSEDSRNQVNDMLQKFDLFQHRDRNPHECIESDKRLLNLASTMILKPDIIVLDEPTAGLDYRHTDRFLSLCADYADQGNAIIMITHDAYAVRRWTTREITFNLHHKKEGLLSC
jgi:energy-coupling factor transporter ATP-binding protein EcfA2